MAYSHSGGKSHSHSRSSGSRFTSSRGPRTSGTSRHTSARSSSSSSYAPSASRSYTPRARSTFSGGPRGPSRFGGRPSHSSSRSFSGGGRGGSRSGSFGGARGGKRQNDENIDIARFINRSVVTEEVVTHFIPEHQFSDFDVSPVIKTNLAKKGYTTPTPIQDRAIPHIIRGEDMVGIANTGTGKTGAFLIPLIDRVLKRTAKKVIIMVPTRELALQIEEEFRGFAHNLRLSSVVCVGGLNINPQIRALRREHHFVIGTPGRIKDLIERKMLNLSTFNAVVLDEADRMLDMGFIHDMRHIMEKLPTERHTLFFSATLSRDVEGMIVEFLKEPVRISVKTRETSANIDQDIVKVPPGKDKVDVLAELLKGEEFTRVIIFGRTKHGVDKLARVLSQRGFRAESIHGNKTHNNRVRSLETFKKGRAPILVATDVAARGLDISDVSHVINYEVPATYDDYVHRIGRTGRGDKKGKALTFVNG